VHGRETRVPDPSAPFGSAASASPSRRFGWLVFWAVTGIVALVHFGLPEWKTYVEALGSWEVKAGPVIATDADGALVVATVVVQDRVNWSRPTRRSYADDYVVELQLNHPDGRDAGRVPVHRSEANVLNVSLLGTAPDRVWLFVEGLRGVRLSARAVDVDPTTIGARFPRLAGQLSDDVRHYKSNEAGGITLVARDGDSVDIDPAAWTVRPAPSPTPQAQAKDMDEWRRQMAEYDRLSMETTGPRAASVAGEFGLDSWRNDGRWIAVLGDDERAQIDAYWSKPRVAKYYEPTRRRLWIADARVPVPDAAALGTTRLADVRAAGDRVYLRGAVLRDGHRVQAVAVPGSPDVLIEHYDAIDERAAFLLTRVGIDGTERWTTTVPLRFARTVAGAGDYVVMTGLPPGANDYRRLLLVSVRLADGAIATYAYDG
jgi:hypothetical protein